MFNYEKSPTYLIDRKKGLISQLSLRLRLFSCPYLCDEVKLGKLNRCLIHHEVTM